MPRSHDAFVPVGGDPIHFFCQSIHVCVKSRLRDVWAYQAARFDFVEQYFSLRLSVQQLGGALLFGDAHPFNSPKKSVARYG